MKPICTILLCFSFTMCTSGYTEEVSLETLRLHALEKSSHAATIKAEHDKIRADGYDTESLQNPEIEVISAHPQGTSKGDASLRIEMKQPLRIGDFGLRSKMGEILSQTAAINEKESLLSLSHKITIAYASLWSLQETAKALAQSQKDVDRARAILSRGVQEGIASSADKALFDGTSAKIEADREGLQALIFEHKNTLSTLTQINREGVSYRAPTLPELPSAEAFIAASRRSEIGPHAQTNLLLQLRAAERSLARYESGFSLSPKVGYEQSDSGDSVEIGVELTLPLWNTNQGLREYATTAYSAAETNKNFLESPHYETILKNLILRSRSIEKQRDAYQHSVIPSFSDGVILNLKQLSSGQGSLAAVWESNRQLLEAQLQWIELTTHALRARLELEAITGEPYAY